MQQASCQCQRLNRWLRCYGIFCLCNSSRLVSDYVWWHFFKMIFPTSSSIATSQFVCHIVQQSNALSLSKSLIHLVNLLIQISFFESRDSKKRFDSSIRIVHKHKLQHWWAHIWQLMGLCVYINVDVHDDVHMNVVSLCVLMKSSWLIPVNSISCDAVTQTPPTDQVTDGPGHTHTHTAAAVAIVA